MAFLSAMDIVGSGLTAQQLRMDVVSENVTNMNTTRTEAGGAYRRKVVVLQSMDGRDSFRMAMSRAGANRLGQNNGGVQVAEIAEDPSDFKLVFDPTHPDANEEGYVEMPNVDLVKEISDAMAASQAYSANVTAFNVLKSLVAKGLEIGK